MKDSTELSRKKKVKESQFDQKIRKINERQEKLYKQMKAYKLQHTRLSDKLAKLESRMSALQIEIDYGKIK